MGYKMLKFEQFVEAAATLKFNLTEKTKEAFLQALYPSRSERAKDLETEISDLKAVFSSTPSEMLPALKDEINTYTKELRNLLKQGDNLSPQEKIEKILLMSHFNREYELLGLINIIKEKDFQKRNTLYNEKVVELIKDALGGAYNEKIESQLHLSQTPYLSKLFASILDESFRVKFQELVALIARGGDLGIKLDKLSHNIITQTQFAKLGLDYQKWTHPNQQLSRSFYDGNNLVEIRQVDMRDISKSLFLGNDAHVCTAIGSFYDGYAIPYIMNTMAGAIEVLVNGKSVGNTMLLPIINRLPVFKDGEIVVGSVNKETALLIDDLKVVEPFNKYRYLQEVTILAEDIAKEIGVPGAKVYVSDSNVKGYDKLDIGDVSKFTLIGGTLDDIWLNTTYTPARGSLYEHVGTIVPSYKIK